MARAYHSYRWVNHGPWRVMVLVLVEGPPHTQFLPQIWKHFKISKFDSQDVCSYSLNSKGVFINVHFVVSIQVYAARCGGRLPTGQPLLQRPRSHFLLFLRLLHQVRSRHLIRGVHTLFGVSLYHQDVWLSGSASWLKKFLISPAGLLVMTRVRVSSPRRWCTPWSCWSVPHQWPSSF